jgi:Polyketide cyclase / dehydrase and lipid transport
LTDRKRVFLGVVAGAVTGTAFGLLAFFLAQGQGSGSMGAVMFYLVPITAGIAIAMVTPPLESMIAAAALSLLLTLGILIASGREGVLCGIIAFPLLLAGVFVGLLAGYLFRDVSARLGRRGATSRSVILLLLPLLIVAGRRVEVRTKTQLRKEIVTTTIHLEAEPEQVWANIRSLESVAGRKPLLMYIGLPIPTRCVLQGSGVGAKRTCYFDHGYIEETVLEWLPPNRMRLSIDRTNMPGRHWLEFEGAEYELHREGSGTALTRTTTIGSNLYPAWYWRQFERWGVASEHEYLFSDLARRFSSAASQSH